MKKTDFLNPELPLYKKLRENRAFYYLAYSALFVFVAAGVFITFILGDKTLIYNGDATTQHYPSLAYWGEYLRSAVSALFSGGQLPLYDFNIGFGADIITTLHYYAIGDPLNLLAVFFPVDKTEYLYVGLIIVRFWLAGVAFLAFCRKMDLAKYPSICGAFIYIFCGYTFFNGINHPYFINPLIYFPIVLIGAEKIFRKEKPYLFIAIIAVSAVSNFYFFYMICIMMFIYAVVRVFHYIPAKNVSGIFACVGKFLIYFLIGVLIAAPVFVPNVLALFSTTRSGNNPNISLFYPKWYYRSLLGDFVGSGSEILNFAPFALLAVFLLFAQWKKNKALKIYFIIGTVLFLSPVFGSALNGFSYPSNRWSWAYGLLVAFIFAKLLPSLLKAEKKELIVLCLMTMSYTGLSAVLSGVRNTRVLPGLILLNVSLIFLVCLRYLKEYNGGVKRIVGVAAPASIFFLVVVGMFLGARDRYLPSEPESDYKNLKLKGAIVEQCESSVSSSASKIDDDSFWRFSSNEKNLWINSAMLHKAKGNRMYFSMINPSISNFFIRDNGVETHFNDFSIAGVQERAYLEALLSTKYYLTDKTKNPTVPFGFNKISEAKEDKNGFAVYENSYALPFGYTYESTLTYSEFEKLPMERRQQVYTQSAVVDTALTEIDQGKPKFTEKSLKYSVKNNDDVSFKDGKFTVKKNNSKIKINFKGAAESETYLVLDNLNFQPTDPSLMYSQKELDGMSEEERSNVFKEYKDAKANIAPTLTASCGGRTKKIWLITRENQWYHGNNSFFTNLGYSKSAKNELALTFTAAGTYSAESMRVVCQDMNGYKEQIGGLKRDVLQNVVFGTNEVRGEISLEKPKLLSISIPYQKGWTAYVDGEKQELLQVNTIFSGLSLPAGDHEILLVYDTPGLKVGLIMCFAGVVFLGLLIVLRVIRRRKGINKQPELS